MAAQRQAFTVPDLPGRAPSPPIRRLVFVLGDQLDRRSAAFDGFDPAQDALFMAEALDESTQTWSSKPRTAMFLAAMRHFAQQAADDGLRTWYSRLDDPSGAASLGAALAQAEAALKPRSIVMVTPGEWRLRETFAAHPAAPSLLEDRHFLCSGEDFERHAKGRKQLRLEFFYREMRVRHSVLMDGDEPAGGQWNFDAENRKSFPASGPQGVPAPLLFQPDAITREVIDLIDQRLSGHPGSLDRFAWPVTRADALAALDARQPLPAFYWTGDTPMACLRESIGQTLELGYAHHIQRLMVTGLYALLLGIDPKAVHRWYLAVYVDAIEWVELPNTLGMALYGDGGVMASKPYAATGRYIERMSNYCKGCRFDPGKSTGEDACPFTTLYWDFLLRHQPRLSKNNRMALQLKNLARLGDDARASIGARATAIRAGDGVPPDSTPKDLLR